MIPKNYIDNYLKMTEGFKKGDLVVFTGGRRAGKSYLNQWFNQNLCKEIMLTGQQTLNELTELKLGFVELNNKQRKKVNKYSFSRAKWHEVNMMFKSYDPIQERIDWCVENFGKPPNVPDAWSRWYLSGLTTIKFRDSKDYEWFMLRWS